MELVISSRILFGTEAIVLENDCLRCVCLPKHGGKIASLYRKDKAFELLFQNPRNEYRKAVPGSIFGEFEACGFDDAFPNIDAEVLETPDGSMEYFDHGEIWSAEFQVCYGKDEVCLTYISPFFGFRYQKWITLRGESLCLRYSIRNEGSRSFPCIWACHCLVNTSPDMQLLFPEGTKRLCNVFDSHLLGKADTCYHFPIDRVEDGKSFDFTRALDVRRANMLKIYVADVVSHGICGYCYPSQGIEVRLQYDAKKLPYLGYWVTAGGYRGDWNCALEPTNGFFDKISRAITHRKCPELKIGEELNFSFEVGLFLTSC